jgi:hypothetical protein
MSDSKKLFSPREAALAVLTKAKEILEESSLMKAEKLTKYETENRKAPPSVKYGKIEKDQKPTERDYKEYEVKSGSSKDSTGPRLERQVSPSGNPKEEAEGNNKSDGMEPEYEFKDKVSKELAKEKSSHMVKGENPDEKQDAELGEKVEHDVEEHMQENKEAEAQEGHKPMAKPGDKMEGSTESNVIPRLIGSAKLSKFMEHMHSKRKNAQAQGQEAVGQPASDAPAPRSHQDGQMNKKYEGFKAVEASAAKSGASDPAAVAAAAGREKYGKEAFQHAAAAGKKMGKK